MKLNNTLRNKFVLNVIAGLPALPVFDREKWIKAFRDEVEKATLPVEVLEFAAAHPLLVRRDCGYRVRLPGTEGLSWSLDGDQLYTVYASDRESGRSLYFSVAREDAPLEEAAVVEALAPLLSAAAEDYLAATKAHIERHELRVKLEAVARDSASTQALEKAFPELVSFIPKDEKANLPAVIGTSQLVADLMKAGLAIPESH